MTESQEVIDNIVPSQTMTAKPAIPQTMQMDHPLLDKFQTALRKHLLRRKEDLESEITELDHNLKELVTEREDIGCTLYDLQQEIERQNAVLDNYTNQIRDAYEKRIERERNAREMKRECDGLVKSFQAANRVHEQRMIELQHLQMLQINIGGWKDEIKNEMESSKRMVSKDAKDKLLKSEQKKKMDLLLLKLDTEIRAREEELRGMQQQLTEQKTNVETLNNSLADANTDLEALRCEQKHLYSSWNEVIIAIQNRDKVLTNAKAAAEAEKWKQKEIQNSIEGTRKQAAKEMEFNEKLEAQKIRLNDDVNQLNRQLEKSKMELSKLMADTDKWESMVKITEESLAKSDSENRLSESKLNSLHREIERTAQKRQQIEEKILELLQNQITTDQGSKKRAKDLRDTQDKRRDLESTIFTTEQQLAEILFELERLKGVVFRDKQHAEELLQEKQIAEQKANESDAELAAIKKTIEIKLRTCDHLNKELAQLVDSAGGFELDPVEQKIVELDRIIRELEVDSKNAQNDWLRLQQQACKFSEERSNVMNEMHLADKQLAVIEQKTLQIDFELDSVVTEDGKIERETANMLSKLEVLGAKLFETKLSNESDKIQCELSYNEITERLRNSEMSVVKMNEEIQNLERDIENTKQTVIEMHREALAWERKWKMVAESKKQLDEEYAKTSEIGVMKAEIHRMEVRHGQLKRAQEKLVQDMERCVQHRDHIYDSASVRTKLKNFKPAVRDPTKHRINEVRGKIRKTEKDVKMAEKQLAQTLDEKDGGEEHLEKLNQCVENERMQYTLLRNEIEQAMLLKQENLENIIRIQHRTKRYRNLVAAVQLPKGRGESAVDRDMEKHKEINAHLICVLEELVNEFPDHKFRISKVLQTLKN